MSHGTICKARRLASRDLTWSNKYVQDTALLRGSTWIENIIKARLERFEGKSPKPLSNYYKRKAPKAVMVFKNYLRAIATGIAV
jgi:hypothetical protein